METSIFDAFELILARAFIIDLIRAMNDDICNIHEIQLDNQPEFRSDEFEMLYINVADGDSSDRDYWLDSVKGV